MQLSSAEDLPETAVRAWKRPLMMAVAIVCHKKILLLTRPIKPEVKFYDFYTNNAFNWACAGKRYNTNNNNQLKIR